MRSRWGNKVRDFQKPLHNPRRGPYKSRVVVNISSGAFSTFSNLAVLRARIVPANWGEGAGGSEDNDGDSMPPRICKVADARALQVPAFSASPPRKSAYPAFAAQLH